MASKIPKYRTEKLEELRRLQADAPSDRRVFRERLQGGVPCLRNARALEGSEEPVAVTGRCIRRRRSGKLTFLDIQDFSGTGIRIASRSARCQTSDKPCLMV